MNISSTHDCYGCGVCAIACPKKIIDINLNTDGFYEPSITDSSKCIDCGLCLSVCSFNNDGLSLVSNYIKGYAAWSNDKSIQHKCSSGGVGFEVGRYLINKGYKAVGVKYNVEKCTAEHFVASSIEDFIQTIGSKYIQSYTVDAFRQINKKERYLVTGTPCQIDSFRRYIMKYHCEESFVLLDFYCHGVPSRLVWNNYLSSVGNKVGKVTQVSWRNKQTDKGGYFVNSKDNSNQIFPVNWHDSYNMFIKGEKSHFYSRLTKGNMFYKFFFSDYCLGKHCYENCKFKKIKSSADIRIGDLWGKTYKDNTDGVSCAIAFTSKGDEILRKSDCTLTEHPIDIIIEGQQKRPASCNKLLRRHILNLLKDDNLDKAYRIIKIICSLKWLRNRIMNPQRTINNIKNKLLRSR